MLLVPSEEDKQQIRACKNLVLDSLMEELVAPIDYHGLCDLAIAKLTEKNEKWKGMTDAHRLLKYPHYLTVYKSFANAIRKRKEAINASIRGR